MAEKNRELLKRVEELVTPYLEEMGKELVLVEYVREQVGWTLRIYADNKSGGGITVEELAEISRMISPILDVENLFQGSYRLEVSSPGLDRPLGKLGDFERFKGKWANIHTVRAIDGRRNFKGVLVGTEGEHVLIEVEGKVYRIFWGEIKKAKLDYWMGAKENGR